MEMEKDIWGGSWSPEIESRVANSIWEEKYRVSFELIDSSEERISFLKKLIRKTEEEREKLLKEYPEMSPEESEALIEGDRSVDLINFKKDKEGFVDQLNKDIISNNLPTKEKQISQRLLDLINRYQPADEKREQGKTVESRLRGLQEFIDLLINKLKIVRLQQKTEGLQNIESEAPKKNNRAHLKTNKRSRNYHFEVSHLFFRTFKELRKRDNGVDPTYKAVWSAIHNEYDLIRENEDILAKPEFDEKEIICYMDSVSTPTAKLVWLIREDNAEGTFKLSSLPSLISRLKKNPPF